MEQLSNTPFQIIYTLLGTGDDQELINRMGHILVLQMVFEIIWNWLTKAPIWKYGKFTIDDEPKCGGGKNGWTFHPRLVWTVGVVPSIIVPLLLIPTTPLKQMWNFCNFTAFLIYMTHYFNRSILYPRQISKGSDPLGFWFLLRLMVGCSYNGFIQGHHLLNVLSLEASVLSVLGVGISISGMWINIYHDNLITSLRKGSERTYKIPKGGLFEYVSCANFFGEIVEWWGLALITRGYPQVILATFSTIFLSVRAIHTHHFYKNSFPNYPNRKALIPFIV